MRENSETVVGIGNFGVYLRFSEAMGSGESVVPEGDGGGGLATEVDSTCSICLEVVVTGGGRSMVKLRCGHEFHLGQ